MQAIESLGRELTIVLIAHRVTTLQGCDIIYRLDKGSIVSAGGYNESQSVMSHCEAPHPAGPVHRPKNVC